MAGGGKPGASSRGRGGKFKKFTRGGGHHFSRDLRPLDADGNEVSMWSANAQKDSDEDSDDSEESSEEEPSEEDSDDAGPSKPTAELTREERKKQKAAQKAAAIAKKNKVVQVGDLPSDSEEEESDDDMPANPNHSKAARNQTKAPAREVEEVTKGVESLSTEGPNKKQQKEAEAELARQRYMKRHLAGETDEAKADKARLAVIREKRAAEAARRAAELEEKKAQDEARSKEIEAREAKLRAAALGKAAGKKGKK